MVGAGALARCEQHQEQMRLNALRDSSRGGQLPVTAAQIRYMEVLAVRYGERLPDMRFCMSTN